MWRQTQWLPFLSMERSDMMQYIPVFLFIINLNLKLAAQLIRPCYIFRLMFQNVNRIKTRTKLQPTILLSRIRQVLIFRKAIMAQL